MQTWLVSRWGKPSCRSVALGMALGVVLYLGWGLIAARAADAPLWAIYGSAFQAADDASAENEDLAVLEGHVLDESTGRPALHANLMLFRLASEQDTVGVQITGTFAMAPNGFYQLKAQPGLYRLLTTHIAYKAYEAHGLELVAGTKRELEIRLSGTAAFTLDRINVTAKRIRNTEAAVIQERRKSAAVSDAISAQQIKKTADSNAAEALKRVAGLSLVDGKFVYVRGMGERYSSTLVNATPVTSPEPNKRVLPMDLIPASLIDNMMIQKTWTPDMPEEFGGGVVQVRTLEFPGERTWSIKMGSGQTNDTTGETFLTYEGGATDFLGFDDGTRAIPDLIGEMAGHKPIRQAGVGGDGFTADEIAELGKSFNDIWTIDSKTAPPPYSGGFSFADKYEPFGATLGLSIGGLLDNKYNNTEAMITNFGGSETAVNSKYFANESVLKTTLGGVAGMTLRFDENTKIKLNTLLSRVTENETRTYEGLNNDHGIQLWNRRLRYVEQEILFTTLAFDHTMPSLLNSTFRWKASLATSKRDEPDRREYNYEKPIVEEGEEDDRPWVLSGRSESMGFTRLFSTLDEDSRSFDGSWLFPVSLRGEAKSVITMGYFYSNRNRDVSTRRFAFKNPRRDVVDLTLPPESLMVDENIGGTTRTFKLQELTRASDAYEAGLERAGGYLVLDVPITRKLRAVGGARYVDWSLYAIANSPFAIIPEEVPESRIETDDWLPGANLVYALGNDTNVRVGYSYTMSRPDLREISPIESFDYNTNVPYKGSPDLKTVYLKNMDLRIEHFIGLDELLAFSLFHKDLKDPVFVTFANSSSGQLARRPTNAKSGYVYGAELEMKLGMGRLWAPLASFGLNTNLTLTDSKLELEPSTTVPGSEKPLPFQSPYVLNLQLFWDPAEKPYSANLSYNHADDRLSSINWYGLPDFYQELDPIIDFTFSYELGRITSKFAVKNITEGASATGQEVETNSRTYSVSLSMGS